MKVAIYTRVSKSDGSQNVERQVQDLRKYCEGQNWTIIEEITENISGRRKKREGTQQLIRLAKGNQIQKVVVHEVSRLGRNMADVFNTVEALTESRCSVFDFQTKQETLDSQGHRTSYANIILPVFAGMSQQWVEDHSHRIKSGLELAKQKGRFPGRPRVEKIKKEDEILKSLHNGSSNRLTAKILGVSVDTVKRVRKKMNITKTP